MVDREKVISGLEICIRVQDNEKCPDECPYRKDICYGTVGLMADALTVLKAQEPGWISVKDRMPDEKYSEITHDFEYCLCATTFGDVRPYKFGTPIGWKKPHFWHGSGLMDKYVTHWMPLPEPPKEG